MTAGTLPSRRSRRAAPLPNSSRLSAAMLTWLTKAPQANVCAGNVWRRIWDCDGSGTAVVSWAGEAGADDDHRVDHGGLGPERLTLVQVLRHPSPGNRDERYSTLS